MNKITNTKAELKAKLDKNETALDLKYTAYRDLAVASDVKAVDKIKAAEELNKALDERNETALALVYANFFETENPIFAAIKYGAFTKKIVFESVENGVTKVELKDKSSRYAIDLVDVDAAYNGSKKSLFINPQWRCHVASFAKMIAKGSTKGFELSKTEQETLMASYKDAISDGKFMLLSEKNASMNNLVKDLQNIVNEIVFVDNGKGLNALKVTSKDVTFLLERRAKHGTSPLETKLMSSKDAMKYISSVLYHLSTGKPYTFAK